MVLTIEPGLYVRPPRACRSSSGTLASRIEDDAVVTEAGCGLITRDVPVEADEIEALMRAEPVPWECVRGFLVTGM